MKKKGTRSYLFTIGGAVIVFLLVAGFLGGLQDKTQVVVAAANIPAGARLIADYLALQEVHSDDVLPDALTAIEDAEGQVLTIARAPGDQLTSSMVGAAATVGISTQLEPGHRAIAIHVNQASGLLGVIRPGDRISVIAIVDPQVAQMSQQSSSMYYTPVLDEGELGEEEIIEVQNPAPAAYMVISGLRVLLVPQLFRYEEVLPTEEEGMFAPARTSSSATASSVIMLDVPTDPIQVTDDLEVSAAALLALLDNTATMHLVLEPASDDGITISVGAELGDLYRAMVGWETTPASTEGSGPAIDSTAPITGTGN